MSNKWDIRCLELADLVGSWSKDPDRQVGAVIMKGKRLVSTGFNGYPTETIDQIENTSQKLLKTVHAELNALLFARENLSGCTIYVSRYPCSGCAGAIIQKGIKIIKCPKPRMHMGSKWFESFKAAGELFQEAKVKVIYVKPRI